MQDGDTPLLNAVLGGQTEITALLLEKGADKDAKNQVGHCRCHSIARVHVDGPKGRVHAHSCPPS